MGVWVLVEKRIGCQIPRAIVADIKTHLTWMLDLSAGPVEERQALI